MDASARGSTSRARPGQTTAAPLRAVFFDLDDTLFDHAGARRAALRAIRPELGLPRTVTLDALDARYQALILEFHPRVLAGELSRGDARSARLAALAAEFGAPLAPDESDRLARTYAAVYKVHRRAAPGARELLARLRKQLTVGIITNNLVAEQQEKLRAIGLAEQVDVLLISEEIGVNKPDPRIFEAALERAGAGSREAVMVGDSWEADIEGALGVGIAAVWYHPEAGTVPPRDGVPVLTALSPAPAVERVLRAAHRAGAPAG